MKILLINKSHFAPELEARGHQVLVAALSSEFTPGRFDGWSLTRVDIPYEMNEPIETLLRRLPNGFTPEAIVYHDDSHPYFRIEGLERSPAPVLFYQIDAHIHHLWFPEMIGAVASVWVAQRDYLPIYKKRHPVCSWQPLWRPERIPPAATRDIPICFRGNTDGGQRAQRVQFLSDVTKKVPLDTASGPYQEAYARSKIVLNESISDELNFRVFEAMGSGALLVTPRVENGLLDLFREGVHLATYERGNAADAIKKLEFYLQFESSRAQIAREGQAEVERAHTPAVRAAALEQALLEARNFSPPMPHYSSAYRLAWVAKVSGSEITASQAKQLCALLTTALETKALPDTAGETLPFLAFEVLCKWSEPDAGPFIRMLRLALERFPLPVLRLLLIQVLRTHDQSLAQAEAVSLGLAPDALESMIQSTIQSIKNHSIFRRL